MDKSNEKPTVRADSELAAQSKLGLFLGKRKTEFLALLMYGLITLADGTRWINISEENMTILAWLVGGYMGVRTYAKANGAGKPALPAGGAEK